MTSFQCPNCQCEVTLTEAAAKRLSSGVAWFCLGGLLAAVAAGYMLPHVGPAPLAPDWMAQVREARKADANQAEEMIRTRQADNEKEWHKRMSPVERGVVEAKALVRAVAILMLCLGIPAAILAITIRPEPIQKRPPKAAA